MNQNLKSVLIFLSGAVVGGVSTFFAVKKYFELKADLEVAEVRDAYDELASKFEEPASSEDGKLTGPEEIDEDKERKDIPDKSTSSIIAEKFNNKPPLKDYAKMFKEKESDGKELKVREIVRSEDLDPANLEYPEDDEPYTDDEDEDSQMEYEDYKLNGEHKKALKEDRKPYVIEPSDFELTCSNYEKTDLLYYIHEDVLCEDSGEEISRLDTIGACLETSGFDNNEDDVLFVRNDKLMCDYQITKLYVPYEK